MTADDPSLLDRLRQRKIVQWGIAYLAGAWLLLQLLDVLAPIVGLPLQFQRGVLVSAAIGLVLVVVLAWYHGERGRQRVSGPELLIVGGVLAIGAGALSLLPSGQAGGSDPTVGPPAGERSIAILPFTDYSPDRDQEYFGDGIAEELMSTVARIPGLQVAARTSSFAFKGSSTDVREIGRVLGVANVVEGSVRKSADRLRIDARIVKVEDGFPLWQERFESDVSEVFEIQDRIANAVATALELQLGEESDALVLPGQTSDHEAQDLYYRGRFDWNLRTREGLEAAVLSFRHALDLDPGYARALAGLADSYAVLGFYDHRPPVEAFPLAREAARQALELEGRLAEPHATLGYVALYYDWDWPEAEREFERAIQVNPAYPVAHQWYANYLVAMGRFGEAVDEMRRASELDPLSMIAHAALGWVHLYAGDPAAAAEQLQESLVRDRNFVVAYDWLGRALADAGRLDEGAAATERFAELSRHDAVSRAAVARLRALQGRSDEARQLLEQLDVEARSSYVPSYEIAAAWVALDDAAMAIGWLERAYGERAHSLAFLAVDPRLRPLHGRGEFETLRSRLALDQVSRAVPDVPRRPSPQEG
ncbi:MAG: hypothetical protein R3195_13410 [Gemmatimonadota bacterium]|nr:hypothetical protein [Gemmatimonadota bacterium]